MNKKIILIIVLISIILLGLIAIVLPKSNLNSYLAFKYHTPDSAKAAIVTETVKEGSKQADIKYDPSVVWNDEALSDSMTAFGISQSSDFLIVYSVLKQYCDMNNVDISTFEVGVDAVYEDGVWLYILNDGFTTIKIVADYYNGEMNGYLKE